MQSQPPSVELIEPKQSPDCYYWGHGGNCNRNHRQSRESGARTPSGACHAARRIWEVHSSATFKNNYSSLIFHILEGKNCFLVHYYKPALAQLQCGMCVCMGGISRLASGVTCLG